jgi:hypothetical protein
LLLALIPLVSHLPAIVALDVLAAVLCALVVHELHRCREVRYGDRLEPRS